MSNDYAKLAANNLHNLKKSAQLLIGICSGLVADGQINREEIIFLREWLHEHADIASIWPGNMIAKRIEDILADGIITNEERDNLLNLLQEITGNHFTDTGIAEQSSPALPIDPNPIIEFSGKTVCFTGKFIFGSRSVCEAAIAEQGGIAEDTVTKRLDYLVIGSMVTPDWANSSYGRKIEKAVVYCEEHNKPIIISEYQWSQASNS